MRATSIPARKLLLKTLPVIRTECPDAAKGGRKLKAAGARRTHMHLDLDVHDPDELQANRYAHVGRAADPNSCARRLCGMARLAADRRHHRSPPTIRHSTREADVPPLVGQLLTDLLATVERS